MTTIQFWLFLNIKSRNLYYNIVKRQPCPHCYKVKRCRGLCLWGTYRSHRRFGCSCRWTDCRHSSGYHWCSCRCPWNMAQNLIKIHQIAMSLFLIDVMRYKNFAFNQKLKECDLRFYFHFTINQTSIGF